MLALADVLGRAVLDPGGIRVGVLADLSVRLHPAHPPVVAVWIRAGRGELAAEWSQVAELARSGVRLRSRAGEVRGRGLADDELRLSRHVLDTQIVDISGRRLSRVGDILLEREQDRMRVAAVEVGTAPVLRRLGLGRLAARTDREYVDWPDLHLVSIRGHRLQLTAEAGGVHRLSPVQLAGLVSHVPVARGAEVLRAVHPGTAAAVLRRLGGAHATAAEVMERDVPTARLGESAEAIRRRVGDPEAEPPTVFLVDEEGILVGAIPPGHLLAGDVSPVPLPAVLGEATIESIVAELAAGELPAMPVVDGRGRLLGAIAVHGMLERLLAERTSRRRRFRRLGTRAA